MNTDDLFEKHSVIYYDANDQKTEVITKRRFCAAIAEIEQQLYVEESQNAMLIKELYEVKEQRDRMNNTIIDFIKSKSFYDYPEDGEVCCAGEIIDFIITLTP